jgi:O-antigen/teichoic acid export membrane protein
MVALSYAMHPYRPQLSLRAIRSFTHFSGWMLARGIANGTSEHLVNLIIGRIVTVSGLAFFSAGRELAEMATTELQAPIRRAMFPGFAAVGHDPAVLRRSYLEWTAVMVLFTFPVPAGLALVAPDIVRVLMGEQWLPAVALLQILACAGILRSSASGAQQMFVAVGRPRLSALLALLRAIAVIPLVLLGALAADAAGAAWAMFATAALMFVVNLIVVTRVLQLPRSAMLRVSSSSSPSPRTSAARTCRTCRR